ncbi:hypothetical protein SteCoe_213 [Stentor coeruleus]|uniref:Transmembrane protein n=1 Tax=Stentor coeruleus TaxID=5963 RepID=A0A1R2D4R1_9CILI|nr:hypothetical protein SteCoe_213 [Stentor coeruleus]
MMYEMIQLKVYVYNQDIIIISFFFKLEYYSLKFISCFIFSIYRLSPLTCIFTMNIHFVNLYITQQKSSHQKQKKSLYLPNIFLKSKVKHFHIKS